MKKLLLSLLLTSATFMPCVGFTFWNKPKPTKKQIIYLKTKSFLGHRVTQGVTCGALGAFLVLSYQDYMKKYGAKKIIGNM